MFITKSRSHRHVIAAISIGATTAVLRRRDLA